RLPTPYPLPLAAVSAPRHVDVTRARGVRGPSPAAAQTVITRHSGGAASNCSWNIDRRLGSPLASTAESETTLNRNSAASANGDATRTMNNKRLHSNETR